MAQVNANDAKRRKEREDAATKTWSHMTPVGRDVISKIQKIEAAMLPAFDPIAVQKEQDAWSSASLPVLERVKTMRTPVCPDGFGGECYYPRCACAKRDIQPKQSRDEQEPSAPASIKHLAVMCFFTALVTVAAIASSPALLDKAVEVLQSWF